MRSLIWIGLRNVDVQRTINGIAVAILPSAVEACVDFHNDRSCKGGIMTRVQAVGEGVGTVLAFDPVAMRYGDFQNGADARYGFLDGYCIGLLNVVRVAI